MPKPWYYDALVSAPPYSFADWDSAKQAIPEATAGVYTIWIEEDLIYVGMSGRDDKDARSSEAGYAVWVDSKVESASEWSKKRRPILCLCLG